MPLKFDYVINFYWCLKILDFRIVDPMNDINFVFKSFKKKLNALYVGDDVSQERSTSAKILR